MSRFSKFSSGLLLSVFLCFGAWAANTADVQRAYDTGSCPSCDLSGADLTGATIRGDLSNTALQGATLYVADLSGANLSGADLSGADLTAANLMLANVTGTNLEGVVTDERTTCPDGSPGPCTF